jgi:cyclase
MKSVTRTQRKKAHKKSDRSVGFSRNVAFMGNPRRNLASAFGLMTAIVIGGSALADDEHASQAVTRLLPTEQRDYVDTTDRKVTKVADGVFVIRHPDAPDQFPQGNTTVVIGKKAVLVVDSCYLPSSAREDIAQIRRWTKKPVRFLLNTHWHFDHTLGNKQYAAAFPGLTVVAHKETARHIAGYNPGWFERYPKRTAKMRSTLGSGKDDAGELLTDANRKQTEQDILNRERVYAEFKQDAGGNPNRTFERELDIDLGGRKVRILHLGRGNTAGDAVAYLPKERIVVTGDLLDHPVPYLGGGYPYELVKTLERLGQMDAQVFVPGHGEVLHGKGYLRMVIQFIKEVLVHVDREVYNLEVRSTGLPDLQARIDRAFPWLKWQQRFAGDNPSNQEFFRTFSYPGLIKAAHADAWRR